MKGRKFEGKKNIIHLYNQKKKGKKKEGERTPRATNLWAIRMEVIYGIFRFMVGGDGVSCFSILSYDFYFLLLQLG